MGQRQGFILVTAWSASRVSFLFGILPLLSLRSDCSNLGGCRGDDCRNDGYLSLSSPYWVPSVGGSLQPVFQPDLSECRTDRTLNMLALYAAATGLVPRYVLSWNPFSRSSSDVTFCFSAVSLALLFIVSVCF